MLGEAQPQPVAHQCARDGGSDNENREGHLRQLPPLRERDHPATDLSNRLDYRRNQAVVFSVGILRRSANSGLSHALIDVTRTFTRLLGPAATTAIQAIHVSCATGAR